MSLDPKKFEELTKDSVLRSRSPLELFAYYIPQFKEVGKRFCSDLRKDQNPSCVIYATGLYIDFGSGEKFDIFGYLQARYMCNFFEVLQIINNDFNLGLGEQPKVSAVFAGIKSRKDVEIKYKSIPFTQKALDFYGRGAITKEILAEYWIKQLSGFWVNDKYFSVPKDQLCFLQPEIRRGEWVYKIYIPERPKGQRFPVSNDGGSIYGLRQLPESGDLVFITSSKKDIMTLKALGYPAISGTSESVNFSEDLFSYLESKFKRIIIFYDFDEKGIERANELKRQKQYPTIFTGLEQWKDPYALAEHSSGQWWRAKEIIDERIRSIK